MFGLFSSDWVQNFYRTQLFKMTQTQKFQNFLVNFYNNFSKDSDCEKKSPNTGSTCSTERLKVLC